MDARRSVGWNLRKLRVAKGLSQERLALEAGIDRAYVGRVERGTENVTIDTIEMLANALGVAVPALFHEVEEGTPLPEPLPAGRKVKAANSSR